MSPPEHLWGGDRGTGCWRFDVAPAHGRQWSRRDCNLLSNLSVLAPMPHLAVCKARAVSRSAPRRGPPASQACDRRAARLACRLTRCDGAPRGWPTIPMAWASARGIASSVDGHCGEEQHEVRGRHLGCTTLPRTADASRQLRLATGAERRLGGLARVRLGVHAGRIPAGRAGRNGGGGSAVAGVDDGRPGCGQGGDASNLALPGC
jgi:hypothetical protein